MNTGVEINGMVYQAHKIDDTLYLPRNAPVAVGHILEWRGFHLEVLSVSADPRITKAVTREANVNTRCL